MSARHLRSQPCFAVLLLAVLACGGASFDVTAHAEDRASFTLEDVKRAWLRRQEQTPSLRLEWKSRDFTPKGGDVPESSPLAKSVGGPKPPEDYEVVHSASLVVDRGRMRFVLRGDYWHSAAKPRGTREMTAVWDGREGRLLYVCSAMSYSEGWVGRDPQHLVEAHTREPLVAFWPLNADLTRVPLERYQVTTRRAEIAGRWAVLLRNPDTKAFENEIWVDPERDHLIARLESRDGDVVTTRRDIEYARDREHGYYPCKWRYVNTDRRRRLRHSSEATLTGYSFTPSASDLDFTLVFPPRTKVADERGDMGKTYVVREHGDERPVLEEEMRSGVPVDTLMKTEPGEPLGARRGGFARFAVPGLLLAVLAVGIHFVWRRMRRGK